MKKLLAGLVACMIAFYSFTPLAAAADGNGPIAGNFQLVDLSGKTYQLSDYRGKQPVLLFFWTTWCPFCLRKLQSMNNESVNLEKNGIVLLAINAGERRSSVERLVRNYAIKYTVLLDELTEVSDDYHVRGVPTFILVDINGVIRYNGNDYPQAQIQQVIDK